MTSNRRARRKASVPRHPLLHADWLERLRALLPELAVSIVAATCATAITSLADGADLVATLAVAAFFQVLTQPLLYVCAYLVDLKGRPWVPYAVMLLVGMGPLYGSLLASAGFFSFGDPLVDLGLAVTIAPAVGAIFFCLTRLRPLFIFFILELLAIAPVIDETPRLLPFHIAVIASIAALFVMRSSATRVTMYFETGELAHGEADERDNGGGALGMFGQVAGIAAAAAALCLAASLAVLPLVTQPTDAHVATTNTLTAMQQEAMPSDSQSAETVEAGSSSASSSGQTQTSTSSVAGGSSRFAMPGWLLGLLLLALPFLPFAARLLWRAHIRLSLEHEPQATDRAARLYLGIVARLNAAGIVRDEAETPGEFLTNHEAELEELVAPAGMDVADWMVFTDAYEKVRYAGEEPTEAELDTCWRLYDALPTCVRKQAGWRSYLMGPFWRM